MRYIYLNYFFIFFIILISFINKDFIYNDNFANYKENRIYNSVDTKFSLSSNKPFNIDFLKDSKVDKFSLSFNLTTSDDSYNYGNIFQTSNDSNSIRIELQPENKLLLITSNDFFNVDFILKKNKRYKFFLEFQDNRILFKINNNKFEYFPKYNVDKISFNEFYIGTGYSTLRNYSGVIDNLSIKAFYKDEMSFARLLKLIFFFSCLSLIYYVCKRNFNLISFDIPTQNRSIDKVIIYGLAILVIFTLLSFLVQKYLNNYFQLFKWFFYLIFPLLFLKKKFLINEKFPNAYLISSLIFVSLILLSVNKIKFQEFIFILEITFILFFPFIVITTNYLTKFDFTNTLKLFYFFLFFQTLIFSLVTLPNYQNLISISKNNYFLFVFVISIISIGYAFIFHSKDRFLNHSSYLLVKRFGFFILFLLFLFISFRSDSLFVDGAEYHWEYYLGPIIGVINGHNLLWDIPSQYGFLNILIASFINENSPWQSFYLFQSILLFIISFCFLLITYLKSSFRYFLFFSILFFSALHFADPSYIGPSPYPSSSVVRFFFVYLMAFFLFIYDIRNNFHITMFSLLWFFSFLWSAESAFYGSIIYLVTFVTYYFKNYKSMNNKNLTKYFLLFPLLFILLSFLFHHFYLSSHFPDLISHFEYALGYSAGHGFVPISFPGPVIYLVILFATIYGSLIISNKSKYLYFLYLAIIWSITSYYLGRPVSNNITAILPILIVIFSFIFLIQFSNNSMERFSYTYFLFLPIVFILLIPFTDSKWFKNFSNITSYKHDITENRNIRYPNLGKILENLNINNKFKIVYYGNDASFPKIKGFDFKYNSWLPVPLQLIEEPISSKRSYEYLYRFYCSESSNLGIIIKNNTHGIEDRFNKINSKLLNFYDFKVLYSDNLFDIYEYKKSNRVSCEKN